MNWPEAVERSSAHFASAYLWHDAIAWGFYGLGTGIVVGLVILVCCAASSTDAEKKVPK